MKWIVIAGHLASPQFTAQGVNRSRDDVGRDLLTLSKKEQEVNDLPGWHVKETRCFFLNALPCVS